MEIKAQLFLFKFSPENKQILNHKTVYTISPYKTGTTYFAGCFDNNISQHEPMHYLSVQRIEKDFDKFFIRRLNTLDLKFESSGFWSAYIDNLSLHPIAKNLNYICITRSPSSWVTSVINHWHDIKLARQNFFWTNELFWKKKVGVDLAIFFDLNKKEQETVISKMLDFYFSFTKRTSQLKNIHYIHISEIDEFLPTLEKLLGEKPTPNKSKINSGRIKIFSYKNELVDKEYNKLVSSLINLDRN